MIDYVHFSELENIFEELEIKKKRHEFCGVTDNQYRNWRRKGKVPLGRYWALQKEITIFLQKQMIRKMVGIGIIDKEFLEELLDE